MLLVLGPLNLCGAYFPLSTPEYPLLFVAKGAHSKNETSCSAEGRPRLSASFPYSSALDAIQEALQLLESVRPEAQAEDQLLDDKAQALLWLYICTLETKMREVSMAAVGLSNTGYRNCSPWTPSKLASALFLTLISPSQGIERDQKAQAPSNLEEFEVNDLNYEDKLQEDHFLYSNIAFNLAADAGEGIVWWDSLYGALRTECGPQVWERLAL